MISMFMWKVWRESDEDLKKRGITEFWDSFQKFLAVHENILASRGTFYGGREVWFNPLCEIDWVLNYH